MPGWASGKSARRTGPTDSPKRTPPFSAFSAALDDPDSRLSCGAKHRPRSCSLGDAHLLMSVI
ncbi:hypothetical protein BD414DRAFT_485500 [Trametes punicea]|nr:hypothetical protein BD414DRAFT_485500 [Trametes punicea]